MNYTCPTCESDLDTNGAGISAHQRKCRKARQWQRDFFRERGKWPERKDKRIVLSRNEGTHRAGRTPGTN